VVYTKAWVVDLILDLAGYTADKDLAAAVAVEPAAGDGAFVVPMARRLIASCRRYGRPIHDCTDGLIAYEIDEIGANAARFAVETLLHELGVARDEAGRVAAGWVRNGDYLLDASGLPRADYVIGNPPYIRLEDIDGAKAAAYRGAYTTMRGRADIYVAFYEAALRQLAPAGVCAFICADRWMFNQYGAELRRLVTSEYGVEAIVEMHNAAAFEDDVNAYPAVAVVRRGAQGPAVVASAGPATGQASGATLAHSLHATRADMTDVQMPDGVRAARVETWFAGTDPWPCISPERLTLLKRLERDFLPLEAIHTATRIGIGVASGQAQYLRRIRVPHPRAILALQAEGLADAFHRRDVALATRLALEVYDIAALPEDG